MGGKSEFYGLAKAAGSIRERGRVVLVEGNGDVDVLHLLGFSNVVAPLHPTKLKRKDAAELGEYATTAIILFDGDRAGRKAAAVVRAACESADINVTIALLPPGSDPSAFVRAAPRDELNRLFAAATPGHRR